ncbi:MAG: discoidin domain-containing protein, partial [Halanaerobiales bacterium]
MTKKFRRPEFKEMNVFSGKIISILIILTCLLVLLEVVPVMAGNSQYIDIQNVLNGVNTDPETPAQYLLDNNLNTRWASKQDADKIWTEVYLSEQCLIQAIDMKGYLAAETELEIEYFQEGHWIPFTAPTVDKLTYQEEIENLIDLSIDRIVTDRIRLTVSGNGLGSSYLSELKVLGIYNDEIYHKIEPIEITASTNTDPVYKVDFLNDGNTYTIWKTEKTQQSWHDRKFDEVLTELDNIEKGQNSSSDNNNGNGNGVGNSNNHSNNGTGNSSSQNTAEVEFELNDKHTLSAIKLYLTEDLKGNIKIYTYQNGDWQQLEFSVPVSEREPGWFRINLDEKPVETGKVKIVFNGSGGELGGISEVEFWGYGDYPGDTPIIITGSQERKLNNPFNSQFTLTPEELKDYTLELTVKEESSQPLIIELNGHEMVIEPVFYIRGYTIYQKDVSSDYLSVGENFLKVNPADGLTLVNKRLSSIINANTDPQLGDGMVFGPGNNNDEIAVHLAEEDLKLPVFPAYSELPAIPSGGSRKIEDWNKTVVISEDVHYDTLTVNTELEFDTSKGDLEIVVDRLIMGSNGSISITGHGKTTIYLNNDLDISNGSRINASGNSNSLEIYHSGNRMTIQGGVGGQDNYKLAATIYTRAEDIFIQNGASFKGKLYASEGNISIRGGITASELIYALKGNILVTGGAELSGMLVSGGKLIEVYGGSTLDGSNNQGAILAPQAEIYLDQGAIIKGDILADTEKVHIGNINHQHSFYKVPELKNPENRYIEEVNIYSTTDNPSFYLYAWIDSNWIEIPQTEAGLRNITYREYFKTDKLLVKNPQGLPVSEVSVSFSTENKREPEVEILRPEDNQFFTHHELSREKVIGFLDNPETDVLINGQQAYHRGHYFWLETNRIGAASNKDNNITTVVRDDSGRVNYDRKTIFVGNRPLLEVDLADEILYIDEDTINLRGTIRQPLNELRINGEEVAVSGQQFTKEINLEPAYNMIRIEGSRKDWQGKKEFSQTIYREVVRLTPITLRVDIPDGGYYTNKESIIVSGVVGGLGNITVLVNDKAAVLDGTKFNSQPVVLEEGSNTVTIEALRDSERIVKEIEVIRDTVAPLLKEIDPGDGYISNNSSLNFTGQITDNSPVQVYLNNKSSYINGLTFNKQLTLPDGLHKIDILLIDIAGNQSESEISVMVDTVPPADFQVAIDPSDWTSNTQPVVRFETNDEVSGISHYELAIDGGSYTEIASPYKLPVLSNGEHIITVKAVDNAGWETISTTTAYIDTEPPAVPDYFKAVPGDDRVLLRWQESIDDDVVGYRIKRMPEWLDNNDRYVSAEDTIVGEEDYNFEYIDSEVEAGTEYAYSIQAVDRAENISDESKSSTIVVGIAEEMIEPENGGEVEFDGVEVVIPEDSMDQKALLQIKSSESVPDRENNLTSRIFSIELYDEEGNLKETEFNKPAQITMNYDQDLIPEGFSPFDLNIYYYDEAEERWLKFEREDINLSRNKITINTNHFSLYSVQLTDSYSPAKEDYEDLGIAPYQSYFKNNQEYISAASGSLTLHSTDFVLAGRNGLDLQIARSYDLKTIMMERLKKAVDEDEQIKGYTSFGGVWNINLPWIEKTDTGTFVHFEDGSAYKAEFEKNEGKVSGYYHEGKHFYIEKNGDKYTVITKDGKQYIFNADRRIEKIIDRTGQNKISFYYSGSRIDYIIDSIGRRVDFSYSSGRISRISTGEQSYTYNYDGDKLNEVLDSVGRKTEYIYDTKNYTNGVTGELDDLKYYELSIPVIDKIIYPTGAESHYQYSENQVSESEFRYGYHWRTHNSTIVVDKHYQLSEGKKYNQVSYLYTFTDDVDDYRVTETEVTDPEKRSVMEYNRDRQHIEKTVYSTESGEKLEQLKYGYNPDIKALFLEEVYKPEDGEFVYTYGNYNEYDNWGNVIRSENTGTRLVTKQYYLNTDSSSEEFKDSPFTQESVDKNIHNLPAGKIVYNYNSVTGETTEHHSAYQYDQKGNMIVAADYYAEEDKWLTKELRYDQYGNVSMIIDAEGHVTENEYDEKYKNAYLTMVKKYQAENEIYIEDADGSSNPSIVQRYGYNMDTGLKKWELSPLGYVTEYRYDSINRLKRIIYPAEDDEERITGDLAEISIASIESTIASFDYSDNPVKIQHYDDENNVTTVLNAEGDINISEADINAQYISGQIFNKSRYEYDGLNHLLKLKQYLSQQELDQYYDSSVSYPFTSEFEYDTFGRRVLTIDAEGKKTRNIYDELGQVTEIIYNDGLANETSTVIEYYPAENKRIITDPEGKQTIENKDWGGNVVEVSKLFDDGTKYSSYARYDSLGNELQVVDGKGRIKDSYYDSLNRLIEEKLPAGEYVLPGDKHKTNNYRPTITYSYDNNGNKISETDANGNTTFYTYDGVNRLIEIENARGKISKKYYDQAGREIKVVDSLGNALETAYDSRDNKLAEIDGEGNASYTEYDIIGNKLAEYDPRGVIPVDDNPEGYSGETINLNGKEYILVEEYKTAYQYDSLARKVRTIYPVVDNEKIAYDEIVHYDSVGNKIKVVNGDKEVNYHYYDNYWLKAEQVVTDDGIRTTTYAYDKVGNRRYVTEAMANPDNITDFNNETYPFINSDYTTEYVYDDLYRLKEEISSDGSSTEYYYDEVGNKTMEIDGEGNISEYRYNPSDQLIEVHEAGINKATEYQYDPNGNMVKKVMSNNLETSYLYNNLNQLIEEKKPGNEITTYSYDDAGNLEIKTTARGIKE